jgi:hypothetical protein
LRLEWPLVTAADRFSVALVLLVGAFVAWQCVVHGAWAAAGVAACVALVLVAIQALLWTRSTRRRPCILERAADGGLLWHEPGRAPVAALLGSGTRVLGQSFWLDVRPAAPGGFRRRRAWLTRFDLPAVQLRRWTVVLPGSGREAGS